MGNQYVINIIFVSQKPLLQKYHIMKGALNKFDRLHAFGEKSQFH